jgi:hypothetical protein
VHTRSMHGAQPWPEDSAAATCKDHAMKPAWYLNSACSTHFILLCCNSLQRLLDNIHDWRALGWEHLHDTGSRV